MKITKRKIRKISEATMKTAVQLGLEDGGSVRGVAKSNGIPYETLRRYVTAQKANPEVSIRMAPHYDVKKVFTPEQEEMIAEYITKCSKMAYGLKPLQLRKLAYEIAKENGLKCPANWEKTKMAGRKWMRGFLKRHNLSVRKAEACSLTRLTSFNKSNVNLFHENLGGVFERHPALKNPSRIYNLDETGTTTVQNPCKTIATTGAKQVYRATSGERGELVTTCAIVGADGNHLPPVMVFPRKFFKQHMIHGAPPNTLGLANQSGWMSSELFPEVIDHFIRHTHSTMENPTLLIYDNHESHLSIAALRKAAANGVTILTLPPHCSHKLQPLDISVYGPFKKYYNAACDEWMGKHPGQTISMYNVAELVGVAYLQAMTPANIVTGFRKAGICPYNPLIFDDSEFAPAGVTDRPIEPADDLPPPEQEENPQTEVLQDAVLAENVSFEVTFKTPEDILGYPKAQPRKSATRGRKRGKSVVLTDENVMDEINQKVEEKKNKEANKGKRKAKDIED